MPPKKLRFSQFKHDIIAKKIPEIQNQRTKNVGKRLQSFINFILIREVLWNGSSGTVIKEYIFPNHISVRGEQKVLSVHADFPDLEKFYFDEEVGPGESVMYRVYDIPKYEPLTDQEIEDGNVSELVVFVREGNQLNLVPFRITLKPETDVSVFESKRNRHAHFLHDDKLGIYYPLEIVVKYVLHVPHMYVLN